MLKPGPARECWWWCSVLSRSEIRNRCDVGLFLDSVLLAAAVHTESTVTVCATWDHIRILLSRVIIWEISFYEMN